MLYVLIILTLVVLYFLVRNLYSTYRYHQYKKEAIRVFDDTRRSHKVSRLIFGVIFVLVLGFSIYQYATAQLWDMSTQLSAICLLLLSALYAFVPYTHGRWVIVKDGIYLYNYNEFIPWSEMIAVSIFGNNKKAYLRIDLLREPGNRLKKGFYPMMVPGDQAEETRNMIRDFINLEEKERQRRHKEHLVKYEDLRKQQEEQAAAAEAAAQESWDLESLHLQKEAPEEQEHASREGSSQETSSKETSETTGQNE